MDKSVAAAAALCGEITGTKPMEPVVQTVNKVATIEKRIIMVKELGSESCFLLVS